MLGSVAARRLGIDRVHPDQRIWLGGRWFNVAGILEPSPLAPDIDTSALVGYPAAQQYLGYVSIVRGEQQAGPPSTIYVRAATGHEAAVQALLAPTANPEAPDEVAVSQPSDVLTARAAAAGAFDSLFLGLGVVALIVGAVGVANIMIISVLERRSEIGLRRALGATQGQIRTQFLAESILLAVLGGVVGVLAGIAATAVYASTKGWAVVIPVEAWSGGIASALLIGALAGLCPPSARRGCRRRWRWNRVMDAVRVTARSDNRLIRKPVAPGRAPARTTCSSASLARVRSVVGKFRVDPRPPSTTGGSRSCGGGEPLDREFISMIVPCLAGAPGRSPWAPRSPWLAHAAVEYSLRSPTRSYRPDLPFAGAPLVAVDRSGMPVGARFQRRPRRDGRRYPPNAADRRQQQEPQPHRAAVRRQRQRRRHQVRPVINATTSPSASASSLPSSLDPADRRPRLNILPGVSVQPQAIDNAADIVGFSFKGDREDTGDPNNVGLRARPDGTVTTLPPLIAGHPTRPLTSTPPASSSAPRTWATSRTRTRPRGATASRPTSVASRARPSAPP